MATRKPITPEQRKKYNERAKLKRNNRSPEEKEREKEYQRSYYHMSEEEKQLLRKLRSDRLMTQDEMKEAIRRNAEKHRAKKKEWYEAFKASQVCASCGENDPDLLDFHHTNPEDKDRNIAYLVVGHSMKRIEAELRKCICLCVSCHRKLHLAEKRQSAKK